MTDRIDTCLHALLTRFRRQRPLRSGSLLVTILGDSIAPRGGRIALGSLIRLAAPFGLPERLVRTSVARLAQEGWLGAVRSGRNSEYRLTERGRSSFAAATRRIYGGRAQPWNGRWTLVILPLPARARHGPRAGLREELRWLGFGQFAPAVWGHPSALAADMRARLTEVAHGEGLLLMQAMNAEASEDRRLVDAGWDLAELAQGYRRFVGAFSPAREALRVNGSLSPGAAFALRTLLIHEYRKIHLRDPLLPAVLLPQNWIGASAYELCQELYRSVFGAAERHLFLQAETLAGPLPALSAEARRRFRSKARKKLRSDSPG